jgi:hypothetical protein
MGLMSFEGVELELAPKDVVPRCPHCRHDLPRVWYKAEGAGIVGQKQLLICPHCRSLIGYGVWHS